MKSRYYLFAVLSLAIQPRLAGVVVAGVGAKFSLEFVENLLSVAVGVSV